MPVQAGHKLRLDTRDVDDARQSWACVAAKLPEGDTHTWDRSISTLGGVRSRQWNRVDPRQESLNDCDEATGVPTVIAAHRGSAVDQDEHVHRRRVEVVDAAALTVAPEAWAPTHASAVRGAVIAALVDTNAT